MRIKNKNIVFNSRENVHELRIFAVCPLCVLIKEAKQTK